MSESPFEEIKAITCSPALLSTPLTRHFKIRHPILLAGMNAAASPELAAAVTNAGGMGIIGGVGYTPKMLKTMIQDLKQGLREPNLPWGVDLLLPQVGGSARKTNKDYTKGKLDELIDVIVEEQATIFVSAVGVPPPAVVEKLHKAGILVANMVGHPKHVKKALEAGIDFIIAQGGEAGGHTGTVPFSILIPTVVEAVKGHKSSLTGEQVQVVAAGGIYNGRGLAAALCHGASAVWIGTRFVCAKEAGAPPAHKQAIVDANFESVVKSTIFTGRPLHIINSDYIRSWEEQRPEKIKELQGNGIVPVEWDLEQPSESEEEEDKKINGVLSHWFAGKVAAVVDKIEPAKDIIDEIIREAADALHKSSLLVLPSSKL
ncbi:hypothetical protein CBS101457_000405 [Exobasidium rhododendri]|nr:hypothetical protein CBS101457_000405 [Exobasidium rhododendri]